MADGLQSGRLRIAVLNRVFRASGGGAETYSIRVVEQLAGRHDIQVFAQEFEHRWPGVRHQRVPCPFKRPRWLNQLWYSLYTWHATRKGFDIVHSHENTWHGDIQTIHVRPVRGDLLGCSRGLDRFWRWVKIAFSLRLASNLALEALRFRTVRGRTIVAASEALRSQCEASYPHSALAMSVITPGVCVPARGMDAAQARQALGLPADGPVVLFVANDFARKGLDALLGAMVNAPRSALLAVVGAGSGEAYRDRVQALGLTGRVRYFGAREDMDVLYRASTVLAHPTLGDTFAMVVLEAMAHGLPVIVSGPAHCGISQLLTDGENALILSDPRDEAAIARALARVLGDAAAADALREQGLRFASHFTWEKAAERYEGLYLASARRPA